MICDNSLVDLVVVIPVARMDWHLARKMLRWWGAMLKGQRNEFPVVALCSPDITEQQQRDLADCGVSNFYAVTADIVEQGYFGSPNQMIKAALVLCEERFPNHAMLWVEADCVPMRATWLHEIRDEYAKCGYPFMGDHIYSRINHLTGNAVYHPNWRKYAPSLALLPGPVTTWGWDSQCAHETFPQSHRAQTIQQIWRPKLPMTNRDGIRPETALFHQAKDGSLIDVLCAEQGLPLIALDAPLCISTYEAEKHKHGMEDVAMRSKGLLCDILIVTFARDMAFLRYCLKSLAKYASGFQGICVVVPVHEKGQYDWIGDQARVEYFEEDRKKPMLAHELQIMLADQWCPNADVILHMDADCVCREPMTPATYMVQGRPLIVREFYSKITNSNRRFWQTAVDDAIGIKPDFDAMVRHPQIHIRETYRKAREMIERRTGRSIDAHILSGRNEFPQSFAEFPTLATVALKHFAERYHAVEYDKDLDARECGVPNDGSWQFIYRKGRDAICETWSHGGIERYRELLDKCLNGTAPDFVIK